ncbi:MFS general substrate transporter [Lophium mytilinum]|uniref:MFS general substrate transporter n=1 Tax=Lophium mytilinum TaxID=390894 RepID=A0A6A6QJR1_9PEZI|nr:MFS general substrate transporter [Lophium mytilinum]
MSLQDADPDAFPTRQLTILAICRFSEPIAFNSILAYTYVMVQDLHGGDDTDASFYAGLLVSAYAVAEALTAMFWGGISDRYGRKPVVLIGLGGVALSCLIFGLAQQYWVALLARFIGGALNGNVAVMQTMVGEMVKKPEHEPKAFATQPFVWFLGSIIGSAMGGFLAQPAHFYPSVFPEDGLFGRYPYLLPNLVSVVVILLAILQGILFLEETNPRDPEKPHAEEDDAAIDERTPLRRPSRRVSIPTRSDSVSRTRSLVSSVRAVRKRASFMEEGMPLSTDQRFDLRRSSFGTVHDIRVPQKSEPAPSSSDKEPSPYNFTIMMLTLALVLVAYHQMAFGSTLPIYLLDKPTTAPDHLDLYGGLGYTVHDVGAYMAVNGVIALLIQGFIFPPFVEKVGVWYSFVSMIVLYPISYVVMPFISVLPKSVMPAGIYGALILQNFFGIIMIPCGLILLKNAAHSPKVLGRVNGMAMSGTCLARTIASPLVGLIYSRGGSGAAWFSCTGVAVLAILQMFWVPRKHVHDVDGVHVESNFGGRTGDDDVASVRESAIGD